MRTPSLRPANAPSGEQLDALADVGLGILHALTELRRKPGKLGAEHLAVVLGAAQRRAAQLAHQYAQCGTPAAAGNS